MTAFRPWRVVHHDLRTGVPILPPMHALGGVLVVLWWRSTPLGQLTIRAGQSPRSEAALREAVAAAVAPALFDWLRGAPGDEPLDLAALRALAMSGPPLEQFERLLAARPQRVVPISVVVCTRARPAHLRNCLNALRALRRRPHEIIVVDNAPDTSATREVVEAFPETSYVLEPRPGLDRARNTGVRAARGEIIAFLDDDADAHADWLGALADAFDAPDVALVAGLVLPAELETEAQYVFETRWGLHRGYRPRTFDRTFYLQRRGRGLPVWEIGAGANLAVRRSVLERLGGFDERLDSGAAGVGGDSELCYRVLAAGLDCRYDPRAVVHHHHRRAWSDLERQLFMYMRGHVAALLVQYERYRDGGNLRRLFGTLPRWYGRRLLRRLLRREASTDSLTIELRGCVAGLGYYLRHRGARTAVPPIGARVEERVEPPMRAHLP